MQKTERDLTDIEMIDTLLDIVDLIIRTYDEPIRAEFQKTSRCSQFGYDTMMLLMSRNFIKPGKKEEQLRLETEKQKNGAK